MNTDNYSDDATFYKLLVNCKTSEEDSYQYEKSTYYLNKKKILRNNKSNLKTNNRWSWPSIYH